MYLDKWISLYLFVVYVRRCLSGVYVLTPHVLYKRSVCVVDTFVTLFVRTTHMSHTLCAYNTSHTLGAYNTYESHSRWYICAHNTLFYVCRCLSGVYVLYNTRPHKSSANDRSLLQKSPTKETMFCKRDLYLKTTCVVLSCTRQDHTSGLQMIGLFCRTLSLL